MKKYEMLTPVLISKIKLLLPSLIVLILVSVLSYKLVISQYSTISKFRKSNNESLEKLTVLEKKALVLEELQNSQLISSFRNIDNLLPSDKNIPYLISVLNQLELKNNIYIEGLSFKPGIIKKVSEEGIAIKDEKGYQTMNFILSYAGTENTSIQFLEDILNNAPLFSIDSLAISMQEGSVNITADISTFFLPLPRFIGDLETPLAMLTSKQQSILNKISTFNVLAEDFTLQKQGSPSSAISKTKSIFNF